MKKAALPVLAGVLVLLGAVTVYYWNDTSIEGSPAMWLTVPGASSITPDVDKFYKIIFWLTGVTFLLVEGALIAFMVMYRRRPGVRPHYTHGDRKAEIIWTAIPGFILLALALGQGQAWAKAKQQFPVPGGETVSMQVLAQQFEWNFRYPWANNGKWFEGVTVTDVESGEKSPITSVKEEERTVYSGTMFLPVDRKVLMHMGSADVIHSLFLPHMRVKQDAVPGMKVRVWFEPTRFFLWDLRKQKLVWVDGEEDFQKNYADRKIAFSEKFSVAWDPATRTVKYDGHAPGKADEWLTVEIFHKGQLADGPASSADYALGIFEIACAELCGASHYKMKSKLWVGTEAMFRAWLSSKAGSSRPKIWNRWSEEHKTAW